MTYGWCTYRAKVWDNYLQQQGQGIQDQLVPVIEGTNTRSHRLEHLPDQLVTPLEFHYHLHTTQYLTFFYIKLPVGLQCVAKHFKIGINADFYFFTTVTLKQTGTFYHIIEKQKTLTEKPQHIFYQQKGEGRSKKETLD